MKIYSKIALLLGGISLSLASYALDGGKTSVKGEMSVDQGSTTLFREDYNMVQRGAASFNNGSFTMEPKLEMPEFLILTTTDPIVKGFTIYLQPGDDLLVSIKDKQVKLTGKGSELNQFYVDLGRKYNFKTTDYSPKKVYTQRVNAIKASTLGEVKKNAAALIGFTQGEYLNAVFGAYMESKTSGTSDVIQKPSFDDSGLELVPEITEYYNWFKTINEIMYAKLEKGTLRISSSKAWIADFAKEIKNQELREDYIVKLIDFSALEEDVFRVPELAATALPLVKKEANITKIKETLKRAAGITRYNNALPGTDFSAFTFQRPDGTKVSLADYKGKLIFMDIWSTWCKPCIAEIPFMKKLEHDMAGKDIVFLSVSGDSKEDYWQDFLKKRNMKGEQLWMVGDFKDPFFLKVGKTGIPRFVVLDENGKMINAKNCLRPSNPILPIYLEELLNAQVK